MTKFVTGLFSDGDRLALIRKNRPSHLAGKLCGIGGHIEKGELSRNAMAREFFEETGHITHPEAWDFLIRWHIDDENGARQIDFWKAHGDVDQLRTMTDEEIVIVRLPLSLDDPEISHPTSVLVNRYLRKAA